MPARPNPAAIELHDQVARAVRLGDSAGAELAMRAIIEEAATALQEEQEVRDAQAAAQKRAADLGVQIADLDTRLADVQLELDAAQAEDVRFGRKLSLTLGHDGPVALFAPDGAFLALYEQDGTLANVARQSQRMRERLEAAPYPVRGLGLLLAVTGGGAEVCRAARRHGLVIRPLGDAVIVCPQLAIGDQETDLLADALLAAYADVA